MDTYQSTSEVPDPAAAVGYAGVLRELLPIALWREDAEGRVVEWSLAAQDLLGHRPEDILGRPGTAVLVPDANRELAEDLTRRVQAGETVVGTLPVRHRDGHQVPMEMWIVPAADPQGRTGAMLIAVETSEVLHMRDSLAALQSLFTQSPIGLATLGPDLRFLRVNDALARMNGVPAAEHLGRRLTEVVPGVNAAALEATMRKVLECGSAVVDVRRTGRTPADPEHDRTWSCSYAPLLDGSGRRLGLIASLIDITEGQRAQLEAERARTRFDLLAEAGTRIGTTLDLRQTAQEIVDLLVPELADSADVQLLEAVLEPDEAGASTHGVLRRLAAAFPDPFAPTSRLKAGQTFRIPAGTAYEQVIKDGVPMNLYSADVPALITDPRADALRAYLATLGSARMVPLVARGKVLGAVAVTRLRGREPFDAQDCVLVDELVARAALNIDNARMYTTQRQAALTLQRSLTNSALPEVPGLELTGRYLPASDHDVGGDWFDVIQLPRGRTGLVIGDVMGHGIHAAAVMGQLRTAVRTLARQDVPPVRMMRALDEVVADLGEDEMATCVYAVHDPATGSCVIARAGHPPPAVAGADGSVTFLQGPPGPPLGTGRRDDWRAEELPLPPGSLLALYTDGLIECRDRDLDEGMERLARALRQASRPLEELVEEILDQLLPSAAQDDVAVLLARTRS
ncbi:SpoIIE family protein phosphatase [Streptomyces sp. NBC_00249]|uniref:SpoIIE family protein phosphatase n=1 Tax=Streptomyces sp. NBC_00249 TaxID=2975690 RepID=UPI002257B314|nr:SpoIIE family protein phosphatase [Streptomyces sp. NBC_00249]MCX5193496.1 SpoIIE family protein phosphatase [Streptomyces sp. NBC_00249]